MWNPVFLSRPVPFIYFSKVDWPKSVSDSWKFICAWALGVQGVDTGEVSERVFVKSHLSELVISSQNPIFNSKAEIQNPRRFHPSKPEPPLSQGIPCACMGRTKGMGGNAKEIQIIFHNPECIQNKIFQGGLNYRSTWQSKGRKRQKKSCSKTLLFCQPPRYLHWFTFHIWFLGASSWCCREKNVSIFTEIKRALQISISCGYNPDKPEQENPGKKGKRNLCCTVLGQKPHTKNCCPKYVSANKRKRDYQGECGKMTVLRSWPPLHNKSNSQCLQQNLHINTRGRTGSSDKCLCVLSSWDKANISYGNISGGPGQRTCLLYSRYS